MARCDAGSAAQAGVRCADFDRLQAQVADQTRALRARLRTLADHLHAGRPTEQDRPTVARFDKYMGKGSSGAHDRVAFAYNVLTNAETQLRSNAALVSFDRALGGGGTTEPGRMIVGSDLNTNTILHEAIHFGTAVWRSRGGLLPVLDRGNLPGTLNSYGSLRATLDRARYGWELASKSAASFSWLVTGP